MLEQAYAALKPEEDYVPPLPEVPPSGAARRAQTGVPLERLDALNRELLKVPEGFTVHRKLERGARAPAAMLLDSPTSEPSTGRRPKSSRSPRFSRTASPSG